MTKTKYKIIYDIDRDIWNWYYGVNYSDNGQTLKVEKSKQIVCRLTGLKSLKEADPIVRPFLNEKINDKNSNLNKFIDIAEFEFQEKFKKACRIIEKITNRPLSNDEFTFFVTTFPRMVAFFEEGIIFMYAKIDNELWGMPIDGFLHEVLHFQFNKYWREDDSSPVSKLSEEDYFKLKESLTVILDSELQPIISLPDCSYSEFYNYRMALHEHWRDNHDFDSLVEFGIDTLGDYGD